MIFQIIQSKITDVSKSNFEKKKNYKCRKHYRKFMDRSNGRVLDE